MFYEQKQKVTENLPTSVKTSAGTPLAIKIVQSCFNRPIKKKIHNTFISSKYVIKSVKKYVYMIVYNIYLWNILYIFCLNQINTFLSIVTKCSVPVDVTFFVLSKNIMLTPPTLFFRWGDWGKGEGVCVTYHTGTSSADRPWFVAGECWGTQGISPATTRLRSRISSIILHPLVYIHS